MELDITPLGGDTALLLTLNGRLDTAGVDRVEARFVAATAASRKNVAVDLSGVSLITSMGLRLLISAARAMSQRQHRLVIFGAQGMVADVLETSAIDTLMAVVPSRSEALDLLGLPGQ